MDLFAILNLISLVTGIVQTAKSNTDIATKIEQIAAPLVPALVALAQKLFPGVPNPVAVGAIVMDVATVKHIQAALVAKGAKIDVDGLYGAATKAAVSAYQKSHNLTVDGWAGKNTQAALFA